MKAKILALSLTTICVLFLIGCERETDEAERLGLICVNGHVFRERVEHKLIGGFKRTLEPLNITCENGKVIVN